MAGWMLKKVSQSVPLLCLLATYILILFGGSYFSAPANGPLRVECHASGQCQMLATVQVDPLALYFPIFDVLLAAFLLAFNVHFDPKHCFGLCWCEVTFGAAALCLRRARTMDMSQLVKELESTGASGIFAAVPLDVGLPAICFLVAFAVMICLNPWHGRLRQEGQPGPRYMWSTFSWRQHRSPGAATQKRERPTISKLSMGKVVGEGATSKIHEGRFKGRAVAVKALKKRSPEEIQTLAAEYTVLKKLHHPNIIQAVASVCNEYLGLLVLPMCGADLSSCISSGLISYSSVRLLAASMLSALSYMRSQALCHLDVKPGNILRFHTTYVLADFETCSAYDPCMRNKPGTVFYWPPEAYDSRGYDGHKADIYALGVTISEASHTFTRAELARVAPVVERMKCCELTRPTAAVMLKGLRLALPLTAV
ncbi:CIPK5 [Symbiodinium sp. CCMP2592]|nr:CIPK5 [Symbiodinium sp. CCMP2592]